MISSTQPSSTPLSISVKLTRDTTPSHSVSLVLSITYYHYIVSRSSLSMAIFPRYFRHLKDFPRIKENRLKAFISPLDGYNRFKFKVYFVAFFPLILSSFILLASDHLLYSPIELFISFVLSSSESDF